MRESLKLVLVAILAGVAPNIIPTLRACNYGAVTDEANIARLGETGGIEPKNRACDGSADQKRLD